MATSSIPAAADVVLDRFVSATNVEDMMQSLQIIVDGFQNKKSSTTDEESLQWKSAWIWQHEDVAEHLVHLLQHCQLKANNVTLAAQSADDAINLVLQLYQNHLAQDIQSLQKPGDGRLLEALLDVMDQSSSEGGTTKFNTYTRVLALQVLETVSQSHTNVANAQWLQAPNALHRLADTLTWDLENPMEEVVRNQALQVTLLLAKHSSSMAKVFLFAEVETKLLDMGWNLYGGLTKGNPVVVDVLLLIKELAKHADAPLQELIWQQRPSVGPRLAQLLDLRGGYEFLNPDDKSLRNLQKQQQKQTKKPEPENATKKPAKKLGPLSQKPLDDDDDDLDNLLSGGNDKASKGTSDEMTSGSKPSAPKQDTLPRLLITEEEVVGTVLDILDLLLESESVRSTVWKQHGGLCSMVWELALMFHPAPTSADAPRPQCALPSAALQQRALELVARKLYDPATMDRHNGLDRLLRLVCTGGGGGITEILDERMGISQASLAVLRNVLDKDRIHDILLHTIAPPPVEAEGESPGPTVVQKLWNTVAENLVTKDASGEELKSLSFTEDQILFLSGALGGLGVFLADEESREMVFKVTPAGADVEHMLEVLNYSTSKEDQPHANIAFLSLYRFLCVYIYDTPRLVQTLLSSTASTHLATLATISTPLPGTKPMVLLLLGLAMEYFPQNATECGGWTPTSILELLQTIGMSKVTKILEGLKQPDQSKVLPWFVSEQEFKEWSRWYQQAVWAVRKRIVRELAGNSDLDDEDDAADSSEGIAVKPLRKLIAQQTSELDDLRLQLEKANSKIEAQEHQLSTWQKRVASTPTELDTMLNDFTSKTAELEEEISALHNEAKRKEDQHAKEVQAMKEAAEQKDSDIAKLREAETDAKRMEQELQALSQAYASLEEEYRRSSTAAPASGPPRTPQRPGGDTTQMSSPGASNELSTLRAMNTRLREDAKKADEWMAMAVQRMNDMGSHSEKLQQEVNSLQAQVVAAQGAASSAASAETDKLRQEIQSLTQQGQSQQQQLLATQTQLTQEQAQVAALQNQLNNVSQREGSTKSQLAEAQNRATRLQDELKVMEEQKQNDIQAAVSSAQATWGQLREQLEGEKNDLQRRLVEAQSGSNAEVSGSELVKLQEELSTRQRRVEELEAELESAKQSTSITGQELPSTTSTTASSSDIEQKLESTKKELEVTQTRLQEELFKKESTIRELEDRLNSGLGSYKVEDIRARDEEIEELRAANEAAQEWMNQAVEHSQLLQSQIAALTEEKAKLAANETVSQTPPSIDDVAAKLAQEEMREKDTKIESLEADLEQQKIRFLELQQLQDTNQDISIARDEVAVLQKQLDEVRSENQTLKAQIEGTNLSDDNEKLRQENQDLQSQLEEFKAWTSTAQSKIGEIMAGNDKLKAELAAAKESLKQAESQKLLPPETNADHSVIDQLKQEVESIRKEKLAVIEERDTVQAKLTELETNFDELRQWTEGAQQKLVELASTKERLEKEIVDLEAKLVIPNEEMADVKEAVQASGVSTEENDEEPGNDELDHQSKIDELTAELKTRTEELSAAQEALSGGEDVVRQWEDRVNELEADIEALKTQAQEQEEDANAAIQQWQDACAEADNKCGLLEQELAALKSNERGASTASTQLEEPVLPAGNGDNGVPLQSTAADVFSGESKSDDAAAFFSQPSPRDEQQEDAVTSEHAVHTKSLGEGTGDSKIDELEDKVAELEAQVGALKNEMAEQEEEAQSALSQWQESYSESEAQVEKLSKELESVLAAKESLSTKLVEAEAVVGESKELRALNDSLRVAEDDAKKLATCVQELETELRSLRSDQEDKEVEASGTSQESEEIKSALEQEKLKLSNEIVKLREALAEVERRENDVETNLQTAQDRISELEVAFQNSELKRQDVEGELTRVMSQNMLAGQTREDKDDMVSRIEEYQDEISALRNAASRDEEVVKQWEERVNELEATLDELRAELASQEEEANMAIEQWQTTCTELEQQNIEISESLSEAQQTIADRNFAISELQAQSTDFLQRGESAQGANAILQSDLDAERTRYAEATAEIQSLSSTLETMAATIEEQRQESEEVVNQWTERVEELEQQVQQLTDQLAQQEEDANEAIASWASKGEEAESDLDTLTEELEKSRNLIASQNETLQTLESASKENEEKILSLEKSLEGALKHSKALESKMQQAFGAKEAELQKTRNEFSRLKQIQLSKSKESLEEERDRLTVVITQLEEELTEANNLIQAYITDGAAERATEVAAQALRDEIDDLKGEILNYRERYEKELSEKEAATLENEKLRDDIAALVSLNEDESPSDEIQRRTAKAVERLKMKERIEIGQIRKSLYAAIEDLEISRASEKESNERLSKLRLQFAVGEQELISAKSEINFLTDAMEEMRLNEEGKRVSLEYRIGSLEDENDVLRRYHSMELETVRSELQQMAMEKDRLLNQLKETEKTNAALVLAASNAESQDLDDDSNPAAEISKLKIENAHLLTVAADDKARAERRLREALAAHRATAEADTILEHELRLAAESTIENLKLELQEVRKAHTGLAGVGGDTATASQIQGVVEKLSEEVDTLKNELQKLKDEKSALKRKLETANAKAKAEISLLTEECRQAQAKAHKLERDSQFDVAVRSEVEKLRLSPGDKQKLDSWILSKSASNASSKSADDEQVEGSLMSAEAYDLIRKQKEDIEEERKMYAEFLEEHDDLLALLAQHDVERTCLKQALVQAAGATALEAAMQEAEEKAMGQFGNVIKVA